MKIGFIGIGKLGKDAAEVMAEKHFVEGYDLAEVHPSNFEMVKTLKEVCKDKEIIFIAVPTSHDPAYEGKTPSSHLPPKDFDYSIVKQVLTDINEFTNKEQLVVLISTVLPGTTRREFIPLVKNYRFIYNPYLIAMGTVKWDMVNPEMIMIGTEDGKTTGDAMLLLDFYNTFVKVGTRYEVGTWDEAEGMKIFYNTFISTKIALVNMIQDVAEKNGNMNVDKVTGALERSTMRIISKMYMKAGMGDGGGCMMPNGKIFTSNGIMNIEDIEIGDMILTHNGSYKRVDEIYKRPFNGLIRKIKVKNMPAEYFTFEHPLHAAVDLRKKYVTNGIEKRYTNKSSEQMVGPIEKVIAGSINEDYYIVFPKPKFKNDFITCSDEDILYYLLGGYYLSEGTIWKRKDRNYNPSRISIYFHEDETKYINEVFDIFIKLSKNRPTILKKSDSKGVEVRVNDVDLANRLIKTFGSGADEKYIPEYIRNDERLSKIILKGLIRGDGHNSQNGWYYSTISENLAYSVQTILWGLGIYSSLQIMKEHTGRDGTFHQLAYEVRIRNAKYQKQLSEILDEEINHQMQDKEYNIIFEKNDNIYLKVQNINDITYEGTVYNLNVSDDHSYVTSIGSVDNCHPRDNIALRWMAQNLELGYDIFDIIMKAREVQAENLAKRLVELSNQYSLPIVIMGRAFKPNVLSDEGSSSVLTGYYVEQLGKPVIYDNPSIPAVYLLAHKEKFNEHSFPDGSVILDVWREYKSKNLSEKIYYYGWYKR